MMLSAVLAITIGGLVLMLVVVARSSPAPPSWSCPGGTAGQNVSDFAPLGCNDRIAEQPCRSWSAYFGTARSFPARVTVPCGVCVVVDDDGDDSSNVTLTFEGGLDVRGRLVFPDRDDDSHVITLYAPLIVVQGELAVTARRPVDGRPCVRFVLTGQEEDQSFRPAGENANACDGGSSCSVGKKAFVVAGGAVNSKCSLAADYLALPAARDELLSHLTPSTSFLRCHSPRIAPRRSNVGPSPSRCAR